MVHLACGSSVQSLLLAGAVSIVQDRMRVQNVE